MLYFFQIQAFRDASTILTGELGADVFVNTEPTSESTQFTDTQYSQ